MKCTLEPRQPNTDTKLNYNVCVPRLQTHCMSKAAASYASKAVVTRSLVWRLLHVQICIFCQTQSKRIVSYISSLWAFFLVEHHLFPRHRAQYKVAKVVLEMELGCYAVGHIWTTPLTIRIACMTMMCLSLLCK